MALHWEASFSNCWLRRQSQMLLQPHLTSMRTWPILTHTSPLWTLTLKSSTSISKSTEKVYQLMANARMISWSTFSKDTSMPPIMNLSSTSTSRRTLMMMELTSPPTNSCLMLSTSTKACMKKPSGKLYHLNKSRLLLWVQSLTFSKMKTFALPRPQVQYRKQERQTWSANQKEQ